MHGLQRSDDLEGREQQPAPTLGCGGQARRHGWSLAGRGEFFVRSLGLVESSLLIFWLDLMRAVLAF
jgi:hypothetical protein